MESKEFHQKNFDRISKEAGEMANIILLYNGIQAKVYGTKYTLTFYYRQKTYHLNVSGAMVNFTPGKEKDVIEKYYTQSNHPNPIWKTQPTYLALPIHEKTIMKKPEKVIENIDKGTQACIDHIGRKIETFERVKPDKPDHATLNMLKTLKIELQQYL